MFELIVWAGVAVSVLGLIGLIWSIIRVARARRTITDDEALRAEIQKALPINLGALFLSVIGLMMVMLGIFLG
ncbi:hypothetical protein [Aestuariivita boseongensis]|uniref:hypothetical protein n=1 Tax=Aestuariivita boseongensis TaxID=1470562 RepID=UPI000681D22E|nr:hypothetical protein [Aestuariivita boseongensis]